MKIKEYTLDNTNIQFYDDYLVEDIVTKQDYLDRIIRNLIYKQVHFNN